MNNTLTRNMHQDKHTPHAARAQARGRIHIIDEDIAQEHNHTVEKAHPRVAQVGMTKTCMPITSHEHNVQRASKTAGQPGTKRKHQMTSTSMITSTSRTERAGTSETEPRKRRRSHKVNSRRAIQQSHRDKSKTMSQASRVNTLVRKRARTVAPRSQASYATYRGESLQASEELRPTIQQQTSQTEARVKTCVNKVTARHIRVHRPRLRKQQRHTVAHSRPNCYACGDQRSIGASSATCTGDHVTQLPELYSQWYSNTYGCSTVRRKATTVAPGKTRKHTAPGRALTTADCWNQSRIKTELTCTRGHDTQRHEVSARATRTSSADRQRHPDSKSHAPRRAHEKPSVETDERHHNKSSDCPSAHSSRH